MKRKNAFFGVHFDFHAMKGQVVGEDFHPEIVAKMLDEVKPDFAQCDTKGHAGLSSYKTKAGTQADEIRNDVLSMWRTLTRERGIPLYAHHSGLYDITVAKNHPEWAIKDENGVISENYISPFSPYTDEILIPQLRELCEAGFDGMWIDGDCWASYVDYSDYAIAAYEKETGKKPPKREEEGFDDYYAFCQRGFEKYIEKYITEIKKDYPEVDMTSNWAYSAYMPGPVNAPIDFISGDYEPNNSVLSARYHGRCIAARNMTWDLMSWGQNSRPGNWRDIDRNTKELPQYCQEAAQIVSLGGGFQFFNIMYGYGGTVQEWAIPMWKKVAEFCRARKEFCFRSKAIPEATIIYPNERLHTEGNYLFPHWAYSGMKGVRGWIDALQESGISSSVIYEYQLADTDLSEYPLLILPSAYAMTDESIEALKKYVENGGRLITEPDSCKYISEITGVEMPSFIEEKAWFFDCGGELFPLTTKYPEAKVSTAKELSQCYTANYYNGAPKTASYVNEYGKGKVVTLSFPLGSLYRDNISSRIRKYVRQTVKATGFVPTVEVAGSSYVEVVLTEKNEKTNINLLNTAGAHNCMGVRSYGEIPTLSDLTVTYRCEKKPKKVYEEPTHKRLKVKYKNGVATIKLEKLEIHTIITVE